MLLVCTFAGEHFLFDLHGRDHISDCEMALDADGRFLAVRVHTVANIGAYSCSAGVAVEGPLCTSPRST